MDINFLSARFLVLNVSGLQFDFSRNNNGSILLQVFKGSDIKRWNWKLDCFPTDIVFMLHFHKDKDDNEASFNRFVSNKIFENYQLGKVDSIPVFFRVIRNVISANELTQEIKKTIKVIYEIDQFSYELNAW
ncbi:MAG: hypothetical protein N4A45_11695 [Flavobacteriales bacterium]|jgi:hypothetical protein|nr:hypothetical protein [Flavobacteriales bacterium]